jgi:gliding motility-associated lipoprotein GldH
MKKDWKEYKRLPVRGKGQGISHRDKAMHYKILTLMTTSNVILILATFVLLACNSNRVYETHQSSFSNYRWEKTNVLTFKPEILDTAKTYRVYLALRHVYGFQFQNFTTKVTMTSPSGIVTNKTFTFPVIGSDMKYLSVCDGDYCDLETVMEESMKFNELGAYQYTVEHLMPVPEVPNVMEFGLIIEKHEVKK